MEVRLRRFVGLMALVCLVVGLWPPAGSFYALSGEEAPAGQLRAIFHWFGTAIRPQPTLAVSQVPGRDTPYGLNTFLQQEVLPQVRQQSLELIQQAGFQLIRQEFTWEDIEIHGKGDFIDRRNDLNGDGAPDPVDAWAKYDNIVTLAEQQGLQILARLSTPPDWVSNRTVAGRAPFPPDNISDYGDFVAAVVSRYRGRITYFQLWNEPNIYPEWGEQPVSAEAYTELLCEGYRRAKAANPEAIILSGALAPTVDLSGRDLNDLIFLQRMYAVGAGQCFDILAAQGYGLWSGPTDQRLRPTVINYPHNLFLRDVMVQNGDAHKPIWISEMGWNVAPEPIPPSYGRVTEEQQARYAVEAFQRPGRDWPWVGNVAYWFFKRPADFERDQAWYYFRLLEPDFTPLPVWDSLAAYLPNAPTSQARPELFYTWGEFRPGIALAGLGYLFFWLVSKLAPEK